ncbi:MAG: tyrosine-type recombinase/integrase [Crenarchaeota archaeon]|nr:tyrosine-type recombinase/integrase [Thermoproteota archaeon]
MDPDEAKQAAWQDAIRLWLDRQSSRQTAQSYRSSLTGLLAYCGKPAWEISRKDIAGWLADLHQAGRADATIASRISGVKSFYNFIIREYVTLDMDGEEYRLREDNPAASFKLPKVERYGKAMCWDEEQAGAFLRAIDTDNLPGLRNKALFAGYLLTGLRNSELRQLRYEDLEVLPGGIVIMRYQGKGKPNQTKEVYPPVYEAIMAFADAEQKFTGFVFHRYTSTGDIVDLPISDQTVRDSLKYYARKAGLRTRGLKVHSLRHTAAYLRAQAGDDEDTIRRFLKQNNVETTRLYLQKLMPNPDKTWMTVSEMLGLASS